MTFRPSKWLLYSPVAALPLLAAWVINTEPLQRDMWIVAETNWFWLLVAFGLGMWAGWRSAGPEGDGRQGTLT